MFLTINSVYYGFKVLQSNWLEEVNSQSYLLEHIQSGAHLFYLANTDDNKVFSITFRTPPADDTGVAHILEHSSLCGSRKYHLKEPFVDLVKGSLNTFLNAMTYPDKTVYPVASRNHKDFRNLMDVYLDAVFYPLLYENRFTLRQEGWHYNLETIDGKLTYNGVVYNEMKGVYSSADAYLESAALKALFPDTCYRFESGGYPDAIPQLTQAKFEKFHQNYYSPENAYIYLYGDLDIKQTLAYLDKEYLSHFFRTGQLDSTITEQKPLSRTAEVEVFYPIPVTETCKSKTYHELSIVTGKSTDLQTTIALRLLEAVLLESESSPLRRALLEAGVGQNISGSFTSSMLQPVFSIRVAGSEKELRDKFISVIYRTLQNITLNGLDKKLLEAALNATEFKLREADFGSYPKGLIYGLGILDNWLYGGNPAEGLCYNKYLLTLREGLNNNYYENLIESYLLDNTHKVIVTLLPQPGKEELDQAINAEKMAKLKANMSTQQLKQYIEDCKELHRRQAIPDSEKARAAIPILHRNDIRREIEKIETQTETIEKNILIYAPAETNKIAYINWYFDITEIKPNQLPLCYLLRDVLGKFDTNKYTYEELATNSIMYTGGIAFAVHAYSEAENANKYRVYFSVKSKSLVNKLPKLFDILESIATGSQFKDLKRFKELIAEIKTDWDNEFFNRGQTIAISRLYSYCASGARVNELDQFSYYQFIKKLNDNFGEQGRVVLTQMYTLIKLFFQKSCYVLAYSCEPKDKEIVKVQCLNFADRLSEIKVALFPEIIQVPQINEGITTAGKVQYVAAGGNFAKFGHKYTGAMRVLETILRYEYLWTKIRIQGGAYGVTARFELNGLGVFASYRDPQLSKTLLAYKELPQWLSTVNISDRELDKYVIGTISNMDMPLTNSMRLEHAALRHIKGISETLRQRVRNEVLDITNTELKALGRVVGDMLSEGLHCVVGGKQIIETNKELFAKIINP